MVSGPEIESGSSRPQREVLTTILTRPASNQDRTGDLTLTKRTLYQLSYRGNLIADMFLLYHYTIKDFSLTRNRTQVFPFEATRALRKMLLIAVRNIKILDILSFEPTYVLTVFILVICGDRTHFHLILSLMLYQVS